MQAVTGTRTTAPVAVRAPGPPTPTSKPSQLRGDIQGMRAVAVLLVLLGHGGITGFAGGYVGVDVFFVLSGFLITGILVREVRRTGRVSLAGFYARRARRILPAATVTLIAVTVLSGLVFTYARVDEVLEHVGWAAVFAANIHSAQAGTDYFAVDSFVSPVQHFWSLAVEEQFYLVWPALIAVLVLPGGRRLRRVAIAIGVLSVASFAWSVVSTAATPQSAYFSTLARGWELGAGAGLALAVAWFGRVPAPVKAVASWAGLVLIAIAATRFDASTPFPGSMALVPVAGAFLVVAGGIEGPRYGAALLLDRGPLRWIGDISFSLYLWHWPVLVLPASYLARDLTLTERLALMAAAVLLAALSHRFVEEPVRRSRGLSVARVRSLVLWPAAVVLVIAAALVVHNHSGGPAAPPPGAPYVAPSIDPEPTTTQESTDTAVNAAGFAAELARSGHPLPASMRPSLDKLFDDVSRAPAGCSAERNDVKHRLCFQGDTAAKRTMVLFGDSHVTMWLDPILKIAKQEHWRVVTFSKASCLPVDATEYRVDQRRPYTECDQYRQWAYAEMAKLHPERIIISGLLAQNFADPADGTKMLDLERARPVFADGAARALKRLMKITPHTSVIGGTPNLETDPRECLGSRKATMSTCAVPLDRRTSERNKDWEAAAHKAGAGFVNPVSWFCDAKTCPVVIRDTIVYRDTNHITTTFAATLQVGLKQRLAL